MRSSFMGMILSLTALATSQLSAQDNAAKSAPASRTFLGAGKCLMCHRSGLPKEDDPDFAILEALGFTGLANDNWVRLDELKTWASKDKHAQAFTSLHNERSQRMGKLLEVAEVHRDKRCLACHTGYPLTALGDDPQMMKAELVKDPNVSQGISCEGCHAPSGDALMDRKGWYMPHTQKDTWRFLPATEKEKFGFLNVRSASARAKMCLSCHLGNATEGKIVTHEMYAAGHPPLPGFELASFAAQMPKHWDDFDKKSDTVRAEFLEKSEDDNYGRSSFKLDNLHETNSVLIAALISFSENLKLSAALVDQTPSIPLHKKPEWPELAQFECFACHHDLQDSSWRQRRTLRGAPGRPLLRAWPITLATLAVKQAGADAKELDKRWQPVEKLLNEQPFGRRERWNEVIEPLTKWLDELAVSLERKPLLRDAGLTLLRDIATVAARDLWDYDSARQLVWAAQVLRKELATERSDEPLRARVAVLEADLIDIEELFVLDLVDGRTAQHKLPGATKGREVKEVDLEKTLPPIARYDATVFREKFSAIGKKLAK